MKILMLLSLTLFTNFTFAMDRATLVQDAVLILEAQLIQDNYKIETTDDNAKVLYLKDWPSQVINGLTSALVSEQYVVTDNDGLGVFIDFVDPSGEFSVRGKILRSVEISLNTNTLFIAVYSVYGGEYGRNTEFKKYYILNSLGQILAQGQYN